MPIIPAISTAALLCLANTAFGVNLIADYQFHNNYTSSVAGAPDLVPINPVSFTTADVYGHTIDGAAFPQRSGLRMDAPANISAQGYSVAIIFSFDTTTGYRKIIDFKDLAADEGFYNLSSLLDFYPVAAGTTAVILPVTFQQVVLTRDASGHVAGYVNGVPQFGFDDVSGYTVLATSSFNLLLDDAATGSNECSSGVVARVRLFDAALTAQQVAALDGNAPPPCGSADFNHDGDSGTDADIEDFFACIGGSCCAACGSADFNGDGDTATDADIEAFFRVLAGGTC